MRAEILRAGFESVRRSQVEAGRSLGLTAGQTFRHVVLFQARQGDLSGARQPVRPDHAGDERRLVDRRRPSSSTRPPSSTRAPTCPLRSIRSSRSSYLVLTARLSRPFAGDLLAGIRRGGRHDDPRIRRHRRRSICCRRARWTVALALSPWSAAGCSGWSSRCCGSCRVRPVELARHRLHQPDPGHAAARPAVRLLLRPAADRPVGSASWTAAALALSIYASAFFGEIWRGSLQSVSPRQWEAGAALGLSYPAAPLPRGPAAGVPHRVAPTVGFLVQLVKDTSLDRADRLRRADPRRPDHQRRDFRAAAASTSPPRRSISSSASASRSSASRWKGGCVSLVELHDIHKRFGSRRGAEGRLARPSRRARSSR